MKYWSETGVFDFVDVPEDRVRLAAEVYRCLGEAWRRRSTMPRSETDAKSSGRAA